MSERHEKPRGPIGILIAAYRADPVRVIVWTITLAVCSVLLALLAPAFVPTRR